MTQIFTYLLYQDKSREKAIEIYLTESDYFVNHHLKINHNFMIVILFQTKISLDGSNLLLENQEKDLLRNKFIVMSSFLQTVFHHNQNLDTDLIKIIDPDSGKIMSNNQQIKTSPSIHIPRVVSRLNNQCYKYEGGCLGWHHQWKLAVYPCLILL